MENCGIYVKSDWTDLLRVEFLFQPSIRRVELLEDHPLHRAIFCYCFIVLRFKLDSQPQIGTLGVEDHVTIEIDAANGGERGADHNHNRSDFQSNHSNGHRQIQLLSDEYNWKKFEDKVVKGNENQISYYKCTHPNCFVKKKVEKTKDGEIIEIHYEGTHPHTKAKHSMKRNSSHEYLYSLLPSERDTTYLPDQSFPSQGSGQLDYDVQHRSTQYSYEI
ncbi:WRKY transcription factor SUSIBA2 isoform X2 [Cajanus cajan]|uniref:WRKY transcription factor SUSIBA2 isoform X2 n=1 Tax=Cajanus cajan TaxID=3821 RepID=UPI0010FB00A1|nr:WRKY transcription factor SUSIBA2 isoform X2 [Cajanus cajan]